MNGHVKNMYPHLSLLPPATTLLSLLLVMSVDLTAGTSCRTQKWGSSRQRSLILTRLIQKETADLLKTYKASQGDMSEDFCRMPIDNVPDPNISGLDLSERILNMYSHTKAFLPHLKRVTEQQTDLQIPSSPILSDLTTIYNRTSVLGSQIGCIYQNLFPNRPIPEPAGGPTSVPIAQNTFQQKVYGCVVLKRLKEFLSNVTRELKILRRRQVYRTYANTLF